jgi:hypothetical protein
MFLTMILAGTGYYKPCREEQPAPRAAELFTTSPQLPSWALGSVMNNIGKTVSGYYGSLLPFLLMTFSPPPKPSLLGFHRAHLSLRGQRN